MKIAIGILFLIGAALVVLGYIVQARESDEVASVGSGIVPLILGAFVLCGDFLLLIAYALWRLFAA